METQSQLKGAPVRAKMSLHPVKRSAKSGVAPSVPGSAEAGRATREAAKALAHETETNDVAVQEFDVLSLFLFTGSDQDSSVRHRCMDVRIATTPESTPQGDVHSNLSSVVQWES